MPEQISKYPDVTLKVLEGAGGVCGKGAEQAILKQCPQEQFCKFSSGEICVYGIEDIPKMTQITTAELAPIVCTSHFQTSFQMPFSSEILFLIAGFAIAAGTSRLRR